MKSQSTKTNVHKAPSHHAHGAAEHEEESEKTEEMPPQALTKARTKSDVAPKNTSGPGVTEPATASDVATAAALASGAVRLLKRPLSASLIGQFANPQMQKDLDGITSDLASFQGCDVDENIALANEGADLLGVFERLTNSLGRVHQRLVFINKNLLGFQTALGTAAENAPAKSTVSKGLAAFAGMRSAAIATRKAARTRNAAKKKNAAKAADAPSPDPAPAPKPPSGTSGATE